MIPDPVTLIVIESSFVIVSGLLLLLYGVRLRSIISEERAAGEIVSSIVTEFEKRVQEKDARLIDILFRVDLLEARVAGVVNAVGSRLVPSTIREPVRPGVIPEVTAHGDVMSSITLTEVRVLELLIEGSKTPKELQKELGRSREHVARVMKGLFRRGFVSRDEGKRPFVYSLTSAGRSLASGAKRL